MSLPVLWTVVAASLSTMIAALSLGFSSAGVRELRWFAAIAAAAGLFSLTNVATLLDVSDENVAVASRVGALAMGVHVAMWRPYLAAQIGQRLGRIDRFVFMMTLGIAGAAALPGVAVGPHATHHFVDWADAHYNDAVLTPLGNVIIAFYWLMMLDSLVRCARRWRRGVPYAGLHAVGLATVLATGVSDAVVANHLVDAPYLLDLGFMVVVVVVAIAIIRRFVASTRALDDLTNRLEREVEERTAELAKTQVSLMRSEKLAAVGQLAAGVAHEINNPLAVIVGNVGYLQEKHAESAQWPEDTGACIDDAAASAGRIASIVRQLLDAGRVAGESEASTSFSVAQAVGAAVAAVERRSGGPAVEVRIDCPSNIRARGEEVTFEQVLENLLTNARHAIAAGERPGRIEVRASRDATHVRVWVTDNGPGMSAEVTRRAFEPFFTTNDTGAGSGLGLAASLGMVRLLGGDLSLAHTSPEGTSMAIALAIAPRSQGQPDAPGPGARRKLLVVDDDDAVRRSMGRLLRSDFALEICDGVLAALEVLRHRADEFDLVLCDVTMPDGGGQRLYAELVEIAPALAARTVLITGGGTSPETRAFIEAMRPRVLMKPLDLAQLHEMVAKLCPASHGSEADRSRT